ncbi:Rv3654c family TadE-like protein [Pseudonocardia sp. RS010]|uniref:Rv3654c family TadE-like protein n=1 Tax=Pseudonocardia sp. RS010 TaxID=3385979 RepID=UPI0039A18658
MPPRATSPRTTPSRDRGSATVWAAFAAVALLAVTAFLLDVGGAVLARHRAEASADLAALAAAGDPVQGEEVACAAAHRVTDGTGAELTRCTLDGWHALVELQVRRPWALLAPPAATGRAHAGPVPDGATDPPTADPAEPVPTRSVPEPPGTIR